MRCRFVSPPYVIVSYSASVALAERGGKEMEGPIKDLDNPQPIPLAWRSTLEEIATAISAISTSSG